MPIIRRIGDHIKRRVLVVDDEAVNREMLGFMLSSNYEVLYAKDGVEALDVLAANSDTVSAVLLDLLMPEKDGFEVLREIRSDSRYAQLPVIVLTSEKGAELESLRLGASDFITKPYDQPEIVVARVKRTIDLYEESKIIQATEYDSLTGLLVLKYFHEYCVQLDRYHTNDRMDAIAVNVNRFHMLNELYGRKFGDEVLKSVAHQLLVFIEGTTGSVCRSGADNFLVYCEHGADHAKLLEDLLATFRSFEHGDRVRLRMGVYPDVDHNVDVARRFDRAQVACNTIRHDYSRAIAYYDFQMFERDLTAERLIEDVDEALEQGQFFIQYQPKFDIRGDVPLLQSAEALVRWDHPGLGMVSPGVFIPLFEKNGLIRQVDHYVWRKAAEQVRIWRDRFGFALPVSVNVSRVDLFDPDLVSFFGELVNSAGIEAKDLLLEVTETSYTEDPSQIVDVIQQLRREGFCVEMDDFGSGYSSLDMLSHLPVDAVKLDMRIVRSLVDDPRGTHLLELILDIAHFLNAPAIAEGVETEEQYRILKEMGCEAIQGYYFSKPLLADEFANLIERYRDRLSTQSQ